MSYFSVWTKEIEKASLSAEATPFVQEYYSLEKNAYERILNDYPVVNLKGSFAELSERLGFEQKYTIFVGFLEGIQSSLENPLDLDALNEESTLDLKVNFEKLYYNMHDAKANWLYTIPAWEKVLGAEKLVQIAKQYRKENIAVSAKVGRNEPCTCGSGKKYKNCCAK